MPTVIDSLVLTFGIDATQIVKGQREAEASMKKTRDTALKNTAHSLKKATRNSPKSSIL